MFKLVYLDDITYNFCSMLMRGVIVFYGFIFIYCRDFLWQKITKCFLQQWIGIILYGLLESHKWIFLFRYWVFIVPNTSLKPISNHFKRGYYLLVYMLIYICRLQCAICSLEDINFAKPGQVSIILCTFPLSRTKFQKSPKNKEYLLR